MKHIEPTPPFLEEERKQTDDSLGQERGKTDESFEKYRSLAEDEADESLKQSRVDSDNSRMNNAESKGEQAVEDLNVKRERKATDAAIEKEREEKQKLVETLLNQERALTDDNLSIERDQSELAVTTSVDKLSEEKSAHDETRLALTTREEFSAIVSHDLRNPISAISTCSQMLLEDSGSGALNEDVKSWIQLIKRNADTALRLISDILDAERIAEGRLQLSLSQHDIGELIKESIQNHSQVAASKSVLLQLGPLSVQGVVECDRDRIAQVLGNLIGNAIKFSGENGRITVTAKNIGSDIMVSVSDTGVGIPPDMKDRIFERFAQIQNNDRRGLGLGLYISKMLVEAHHGRLSVTSEPGRGSTFSFSLQNQKIS